MIKSCFAATNAEFFNEILTEFAEPGDQILDANTGERRIWGNSIGQARLMSLKAPYDVTWIDKRPVDGVTLIADDANLPFVNGSFDFIVFDPPYTVGGAVPPTDFVRLQSSHRHGRGGYGGNEYLKGMSLDDAVQETKELSSSYDWPDFLKLLDAVRLEFWRVLRPEGWLVMKSTEIRRGNELFPITAYAWTRWKQLFSLEGLLYQLIPSAARPDWANKMRVILSHTTWSVWKHRSQ